MTIFKKVSMGCVFLGVILILITNNAFGEESKFKNSFYLGLNYMNAPEIELSGIDTEFKGAFGGSLGYIFFVDNEFIPMQSFVDVGLDVMSMSAKDNNNFSSTPISLYANGGLIVADSGGEKPFYFKVFAGLGLSHPSLAQDGKEVYEFGGSTYTESDFEMTSSIGFLYQIGLGVIFERFFADIMFRSTSSSFGSEYKECESLGSRTSCHTEKSKADAYDFDMSFQALLRLGVNF